MLHGKVVDVHYVSTYRETLPKALLLQIKLKSFKSTSRSMVTVTLQEKKSGRSTSYIITIPKEIVTALGWKKGMKLKIKITQHENKQAIIIYPED